MKYLSPVTEVIIQSAAIYAAGVIIALSTYLANSNVQNVIVDANQPLIVRCITKSSSYDND